MYRLFSSYKQSSNYLHICNECHLFSIMRGLSATFTRHLRNRNAQVAEPGCSWLLPPLGSLNWVLYLISNTFSLASLTYAIAQLPTSKYMKEHIRVSSNVGIKLMWVQYQYVGKTWCPLTINMSLLWLLIHNHGAQRDWCPLACKQAV